MCIRDDKGQFVMASSSNFSCLTEVVEGEDITLREALRWLWELDIEEAILEMDCQTSCF